MEIAIAGTLGLIVVGIIIIVIKRGKAKKDPPQEGWKWPWQRR
jgi:hypothetical protein